MKYLSLLGLIMLCLCGSIRAQIGSKKGEGKTTAIIKDKQGNSYTVVKLKDGKYWLGTNLKYKVDGSLCYSNNKRLCEEFGRLYTQAAASKACLQLGASWKLPSVEDWKGLARAYGGYYNGHSFGRSDGKRAYRELAKADKYGFWARLGGRRVPQKLFRDLRKIGYYWTSTPERPKQKPGFFWSFWFLDERMYHDDVFGNEENSMYSVRCVIDEDQK